MAQVRANQEAADRLVDAVIASKGDKKAVEERLRKLTRHE